MGGERKRRRRRRRRKGNCVQERREQKRTLHGSPSLSSFSPSSVRPPPSHYYSILRTLLSLALSASVLSSRSESAEGGRRTDGRTDGPRWWERALFFHDSCSIASRKESARRTNSFRALQLVVVAASDRTEDSVSLKKTQAALSGRKQQFLALSTVLD